MYQLQRTYPAQLRADRNKQRGQQSIQVMAYADDIDIIGGRRNEIGKAYWRLKTEAAAEGLRVNTFITKYMSMGNTLGSRNTITLKVKTMKSYIY